MKVTYKINYSCMVNENRERSAHRCNERMKDERIRGESDISRIE